MPYPIVALPQRCGACQHPHTGEMAAPGSWPDCPACGCKQFRLHPDELTAMEADDALEAAYFPNGRILDADMARGLGAAAAALEGRLSERWNGPPMLGCFYLHPVQDSAGGKVRLGEATAGAAYLMGFMSATLDLRYAGLLAMTDGNPNMFVSLLADMAEQRPQFFDAYRAAAAGVDPAAPIAAWWVSWESWLRTGEDLDQSATDRPELAVDEIRTLVCIDVDERVHEINRQRHAGEVTSSAEPWPLFAARMTGEGPVHTGLVSLRDGRMPPVFDALARLVRHSRIEAVTRGELRDAAAAAGDGAEGSA